jgi:hypothetical protein
LKKERVRHLQAWQFNILKNHSQTLSRMKASPLSSCGREIFYPEKNPFYGIIIQNVLSYMLFDA